MARERIRKPRPLIFDGEDAAWIESDKIVLYIRWTSSPAKARRLASWLCKAAEYIAARRNRSTDQ